MIRLLPSSAGWLGSLFSDLGDAYKALDYEGKTLAIRGKVLPPEHPDLARSYNNLAETYGDLGDLQKRLEYHQKALAIIEKVLPPQQLDMALSYNNLAELTKPWASI